MLFKEISNLELWRPFCSAERNNLCNFGRGYAEEQFCEFILNSDLWSRCLLKDFLSGALTALLFSGAEPFMHFCKGHYEEQLCEIISNLDQWFRRCRLS